MKRSGSPSFILTLKLNTSPDDEKILSDRFFCAFLMKNRLIRHARKRLSSMRQDPEYRNMMKKRHDLADKNDRDSKKLLADVNLDLKDIRLRYGLSEYQFHEWIRLQQHLYAVEIDSFTAQKVATSVWQSVETVLFRKGKSIRFQRLEALSSLEGKNNAAGIRFKGGRLHWNGLEIQPQVRKGDLYAREALDHRVKYCRIVRKAMGISVHYYLQLVLEGIPPKKHSFINGRAGIDPGVSSEAVFSENGCLLKELAPDRHNIEKKVRLIRRKMDRSRRANNPEHYHEDGTIRKIRKPWHYSGTYRKDRMRLKTLLRRNADTVHQEEECLANEILCFYGSDIITEKMNYKALQKRAQEDSFTKDGRYRSKKRFGKSLARHAPARFLKILERKLSYTGKTIFYVDTWKFKASQYDHTLGTYTAAGLSDRSKTVGGFLVQRDLYSAFLLWAAADETTVDRNLCSGTFPLYLEYQNICISRLLKDGRQHPSSFGLKDFEAL